MDIVTGPRASDDPETAADAVPAGTCGWCLGGGPQCRAVGCSAVLVAGLAEPRDAGALNVPGTVFPSTSRSAVVMRRDNCSGAVVAEQLLHRATVHVGIRRELVRSWPDGPAAQGWRCRSGSRVVSCPVNVQQTRSSSSISLRRSPCLLGARSSLTSRSSGGLCVHVSILDVCLHVVGVGEARPTLAPRIGSSECSACAATRALVAQTCRRACRASPRSTVNGSGNGARSLIMFGLARSLIVSSASSTRARGPTRCCNAFDTTGAGGRGREGRR